MMMWPTCASIFCLFVCLSLMVVTSCYIFFNLASHCYSIPNVWQEFKEYLLNEGMNERMLQLEQLCGKGSRQRLSYLFFQSGTCRLIYAGPKGMAEPGQR